mmetsp:Transcript_55478/g.123944  ORF Transcript_55478/g.123944 Transcript_55478/m.123944 type:complete len:297 (+) Transcript_55478:73-963(+)
MQRLRFVDFAKQLGLPQFSSALCRRMAQCMFELPLPPDWLEEEGYMGQVYFFNTLTGDTSSAHPQALMFRRMLAEMASWPATSSREEIYQRCWNYLHEERASAAKALSEWTGPHHMGAGRRPDRQMDLVDDLDCIFFNATTGESSRLDPRKSMAFDLHQQHALLCNCIDSVPLPKAAKQVVPGDATETTDAGEQDALLTESGTGTEDDAPRCATPRIQVYAPGAQRKPMLVLPVPARRIPKMESPQASPRRCLRAPCLGDESVRSHVSFYSVFSACSDEVQSPTGMGCASPVAAVW